MTMAQFSLRLLVCCAAVARVADSFSYHRQVVATTANNGKIWTPSPPPFKKNHIISTSLLRAAADSDTNSNESPGELDNKNEESDWDLRMDWALQDAVARYTVGSGETPATFWTQLRHSTPDLSNRSEDELEERYRALLDRQKLGRKEGNENTAEETKLVPCGSSPILLSEWWVSSSPSTGAAVGTAMMGGVLPNGSRIWFPLECTGTLGDDPKAISSSSAPTSFTMYSYAESIGGIVYELGAPAPNQQQQLLHQLQPQNEILFGEDSLASRGVIDGDGDLADRVSRFAVGSLSAVGKHAKTILPVIVASTLSASLTLGYIDGIRSTSSYFAQHPQQHQIVRSSKPSYGAVEMYYTSSGGGTSNTELSISEQRARQELKVGRDKRSMVMLQERLRKDETRLKELRTEESQLEAKEWGFDK